MLVVAYRPFIWAGTADMWFSHYSAAAFLMFFIATLKLTKKLN